MRRCAVPLVLLACTAAAGSAPLFSPAGRPSSAPPAASPPAWPRMSAYVSAYVAREVSHWQGGSLGSSAVRDLAAAAWVLLSAPSPDAPNVSAALGMLETVFAHQLPSGQWPWTFNSAVLTDSNAVQFVSLPLLRAILVADAAGLLPPGWLAQRMRALELAAGASYAEGLPGAEAQPFYTNIYTMRLVNLHLFAQATGNASVAAYASAALASWVALVAAAGVHEYSSPTYTAVTLHNLCAGAAAISNASAAAALRRHAAFIAVQSAAAFWAPAAEMGGAHSRDYDFVFGDAGMSWWAALSGLAAAAGVDGDAMVLDADPITQAELFVTAARGELPPLPAAALALARAPSGAGAWRTWQLSFAPAPGAVAAAAGADAYMYASASAALGVSSLYYCNQDKQVVAQLALARGGAPPASSPRLAQITLVQDVWDAPWGRVRRGTPTGQDVGKPTHVKATVASVQDGALAMSLQDLTMTLEAASRQGPFASIAANVVFPAGAGVDGVYVDGARVQNVSAGAPDVPLALGATVAVRAAGGVVAFRIPFADGLAGYAPTSALKFDGPLGTDAARLVVYLYRGANTTFAAVPPPSRTVTLIAVGDAADDGAAADFAAALAAMALTNDAANTSNWRVTLAPPQRRAGGAPLPPGFASTLGAALSLPRTKTILARTVNGSSMHMPAPGTLELVWSSGARESYTPADF